MNTYTAACEWFSYGHQHFNVIHWGFQEQRQHLASAFKGLTQQETLMAIVAKTPKVLLLSVKYGKTRVFHQQSCVASSWLQDYS